MLKSILNKITNNLGLKILAVIFAVILWLVVVNTDDPKVNKRFTSSVTIENGTYLTNQGKYYELLEDSNTITFTVSAKRSFMDQLSSTDFKVVANLENTEINADTNIATVPIEITVLRYSSQVSVINYARKIQLSVEDLDTEQFIVQPQIVGELPDGSVVGDVSATPNLVTLSGPESLINRIDHIYAVTEVTGMTGDITVSCLPIAYDEEGSIVDTGKIDYNVDTITVSVSILDTKDVGIICNYSGEPAVGFGLREITFDPQTVKVKGKSSALNTITNITIPESALDISGARGNVTQVVDVSAYLPSGVSMAGDSKITVTAVIEEQISKSLNLYTSNIDVLNVPEGYTASFTDNLVQVTLVGQAADINKVTSSALTGNIDATELQEGSNTVVVHLDLATGIRYEPVYVTVVLDADEAVTGSEAEATPDEGEPDEEAPDSSETEAPSENTDTGEPQELSSDTQEPEDAQADDAESVEAEP